MTRSPLRNQPGRRGQALTEFLVLAAALVPLFLLLPLIAKYQGIAGQVQMASRYVTFEAMTRNDAPIKQFGDTNILMENLTIKSGGLAAYLVGRNNIIRPCHIEVEGHEAVALFGAHNQLVDNEIVVKRSLSPPTRKDSSTPELGTYYPQYAAIWIRDAPGTGADKLYTALDTQSSVHARNNRKRFGKWPDN